MINDMYEIHHMSDLVMIDDIQIVAPGWGQPVRWTETEFIRTHGLLMLLTSYIRSPTMYTFTTKVCSLDLNFLFQKLRLDLTRIQVAMGEWEDKKERNDIACLHFN